MASRVVVFRDPRITDAIRQRRERGTKPTFFDSGVS
jgi:hypothetical protein